MPMTVAMIGGHPASARQDKAQHVLQTSTTIYLPAVLLYVEHGRDVQGGATPTPVGARPVADYPTGIVEPALDFGVFAGCRVRTIQRAASGGRMRSATAMQFDGDSNISWFEADSDGDGSLDQRSEYFYNNKQQLIRVDTDLDGNGVVDSVRHLAYLDVGLVSAEVLDRNADGAPDHETHYAYYSWGGTKTIEYWDLNDSRLELRYGYEFVYDAHRQVLESRRYGIGGVASRTRFDWSEGKIVRETSDELILTASYDDDRLIELSTELLDRSSGTAVDKAVAVWKYNDRGQVSEQMKYSNGALEWEWFTEYNEFGRPMLEHGRGIATGTSRVEWLYERCTP